MKKQTQTAMSRTKSGLLLPSGSIFDRARNEVCRTDLVSFIELVFHLLAPGRPFLMNWHIQALAYVLEQVRLGRIKRLIINLPPRFLKSLVASVALPAFALGHDPTKRILVISYGLDLATKFAYESGMVMSSPRYKAIFPGTRLMRSNDSEIVTTRNGYRLATSIDGPLTGRGADLIVIDDPHKLSDAESDKKLEHVGEIYRNTILSRMDDPENGAIVIVMQRIGLNDLSGTVLRHPDGWTELRLPMIAEQDERIQIGENLFHLRRAGDLLHPEHFSHRILDERRSQLDEKIFAAQYQQCPIEPAGMMIKRDWIRRYDHLPTRTKSHYLIQSWDTAIKAGEQHDYSAGVSVLLDERGNYCVIDSCRDRLLYPELKAHVLSQAQTQKPDVVLIEEVGLGRKLVSELKAAGLPVVGVIPQDDKRERVSFQREKFENGKVFFPREAPWRQALEDEVCGFPNWPYDDQVDALVQALAHQRSGYWSDASLKGLENFVNGLY